MMAKAVVEILSKHDDTSITIASNLVDQAQNIVNFFPKNCKAAFADIFNVRTTF